MQYQESCANSFQSEINLQLKTRIIEDKEYYDFKKNKFKNFTNELYFSIEISNSIFYQGIAKANTK